MQKRIIKNIIIVFVIMCMLCYPYISNATSGENESSRPSFSNFWKIGNDWATKHKEDSPFNQDEADVELNAIIRLLTTVARIIILVAILIIAIKFMMATAKEQANLKKKLVGLVIALVIVAGSYTIWSSVYNVMVQVENNI